MRVCIYGNGYNIIITGTSKHVQFKEAMGLDRAILESLDFAFS